jgi:hypothetical protein
VPQNMIGIAVKAFSVWMQIYSANRQEGGEHPRGMPLFTRMQEPQSEQMRENQWHSSSKNHCQKTHTVQQPQPDDPNSNTAESMVKTRTRAPHQAVAPCITIAPPRFVCCGSTAHFLLVNPLVSKLFYPLPTSLCPCTRRLRVLKLP